MAWACLILAGVRGALLIGAEPMLAVANNFDMIRVQACINAFPVRDAAIPLEAQSYRAPLERYRFVAGTTAPCFGTSELVFTAVSWPGMWLEQRLRADATFSLRWQGAIKLVALLAFAAVLTRRLIGRGHAPAAAAHGAIVAGVLCDPGNTLFFNTFYAEAAALLFVYALLGATVAVLVEPGRPSRTWLGVIVACAAMTALSKIQHLLLPLILCVLMLPIAARHWPTWRPAMLATVLGGVAGATLQGWQMQAWYTVAIASANIVNTVFFTVLPEAEDVEATTAALGLPRSCAAQSGKNWYTRGMQGGELCAESSTLTRGALLRVLLADPALAGRVLVGGIGHARPWIIPQRGMVEGADLASLPASVPSFSRLLDRLPRPAWIGGVLVLPLLGYVLAWRRHGPHQTAGNAVLVACCGLPLVIIATSVFGDGYMDLQSHAHLAFVAFLVAILLLVTLPFAALSRRADARSRSAFARASESVRWQP